MTGRPVRRLLPTPMFYALAALTLGYPVVWIVAVLLLVRAIVLGDVAGLLWVGTAAVVGVVWRVALAVYVAICEDYQRRPPTR